MSDTSKRGQDIKDIRLTKGRDGVTDLDSFVLDKGIFSNIFERDIRRVYIYKKAERLAKAIHLIGPAFLNSPALRNRVDMIAVGLVDAATLPPIAAREALSRELLTLSSVLSIARTGGLLSTMNADLIVREAHALLQEIATYEEPRLFLEDAPSLAALFKSVGGHASEIDRSPRSEEGGVEPRRIVKDNKGHVTDNTGSGRRDAIVEVLRSKGPSYIKDISTVIRDVSEKTIQRELAALVADGTIRRTGERRWSTYSLV